jgi:predicted metal-dependent phosphoesterase TrpH
MDYRICSFTPEQLISAAASTGYAILAITCHNKDIWTNGLSDYARNLGITLIPGMEVSTERAHHILVYNFHTGAENLNTLNKIKECSREDTLVVAPHPFFPGSGCLGRALEKNLDLFDAIEYSGFQIRGLNFNRRSMDLAEKTGKPLVGCGDIHYLWQLDRTSTWIYAEPDVPSVIRAVKQGAVRLQVSPISWFEAAKWWGATFWRHAWPANPAPAGNAWTGWSQPELKKGSER